MKCPVCGNNTLNSYDPEWQICKECYWEYDPLQADNPDYAGGANDLSINQYKMVYERLKRENSRFSCKNLRYYEFGDGHFLPINKGLSPVLRS